MILNAENYYLICNFKTRRITETFTGPSRIVEIKALLEKEIQLLNGIEKRRSEIQKEMLATRQDRILQKHSETVKWIGYKSNGEITFAYKLISFSFYFILRRAD
jgi:hypothetical protein